MIDDHQAESGGGKEVVPAHRTPGFSRRRGPWLLGCAVLALVLVVAIGWVTGRPKAATSSNPHHLPSMPAGHPAPEFSLPRLGGGTQVSTTAFAGQPVVLNFFASWCPNCVDEMKTFAAESAAAQGRVAFVGVDSNDSDRQGAQRILADAGVRYPVGVDAEARIAEAYWVVGLPTTVFIDRRGRVVGEAFGPQSAGALKSWVKRLEDA